MAGRGRPARPGRRRRRGGRGRAVRLQAGQGAPDPRRRRDRAGPAGAALAAGARPALTSARDSDSVPPPAGGWHAGRVLPQAGRAAAPRWLLVAGGRHPCWLTGPSRQSRRRHCRARSCRTRSSPSSWTPGACSRSRRRWKRSRGRSRGPWTTRPRRLTRCRWACSPRSAVVPTDDVDRTLTARGVTVDATLREAPAPAWQQILVGLGPILLFVGLLLWFLRRRSYSGVGGFGQFSWSRAVRYRPDAEPRTTSEPQVGKIVVSLRSPGRRRVDALSRPVTDRSWRAEEPRRPGCRGRAVRGGTPRRTSGTAG